METEEGSRDTAGGRGISKGFLEERHGYGEMNQVRIGSGINGRQWNARGR